jgi:predicted dehydrogenase
VRAALVGYGLGGSAFHAPFIEAEPRIDLSIVVTSDPERQSVVRARYPHARVVESFAALLEAIHEVDLVVISTPNGTHVPLAEAALRHGRHVVVDKPVAPTAAEVRHLAALAVEAGRVLVPFQNRRWDGDYRTVTGLVRSGELGELHRFESRYERWAPEVSTAAARSWKRDPAPGQANGILYDLGTHLVDQTVALFGRPSSVYAEIDVRRPGAEVDDDAFVALQYPGGLRCHLWASAVAGCLEARARSSSTAWTYKRRPWSQAVRRRSRDGVRIRPSHGAP